MKAMANNRFGQPALALCFALALLVPAPLAAQDAPGEKPLTDVAKPDPTKLIRGDGEPGKDEAGAPELTEAADVAIERGL